MEAFVEFGKRDIEQSIPACFAQQVRRHPQRLAVKTRQHAWTYADLDAFSRRVSRAIRRERGDKPETVTLLFDQGAPLIGAIFGVLQAGKIYLALDRTFPAARLAWMLEDAETKLILASAPNLALAESLAGNDRRVLCVDELASNMHAHADDDDAPAIPPDALAYLFYTSGSTGTPKGVVDSHRNVLHNVMRYTNNLRIAPADRLTLLQSATFSGAVSSMFGALLNGAASFPFDLREESPARLAAWLREERITIYHSVPTIFRSFLAGDEKFPDVRVIRLEGDASSKTDVELFRKHFPPSCILANGLGATETGLSCQYQMTPATELIGGIVPIGFPTTDMDVLLLDELGIAVDEGVVGEIAVRSEFLAPGYWKRPDLTAMAFTADATDARKRVYRTGDMGRRRADGCIEYLGRKDFQLKVRGNRVEPAEVESALLTLDNVREAVVTTRPDAQGEARVVAYVVPARAPAPTVPVLRRALTGALPEYMIPSAFVFLDALPLNDNRKVDRRALPAPEDARPARTTPVAPARDEVERRLVAVWEKLLDVRPLGVTDNFFDWGGDSLAATRLLAEVETAFGRSVPHWRFTAAATVEQLACLVRVRHLAAGKSAVVPIQPNGTRPPLFCIHDLNGEIFRFALLSRHLGEDQPLFGLRSVGLVADEQPLATIEAMAARYLADIHEVQPRGPYRLSGFCFGAVIASEMAHQLRARGESVALLAYLSISPFDFRSLVTDRAWVRFRHHYREATFWERIRFQLYEALGKSWRKSIAHIAAKARWLPSHAFHAIRGSASRSRGKPMSAPPAGTRQRDSVTQANRDAFRSYTPRHLSGRVVVVLDEDDQRQCTPEPMKDYRGLTTGDLATHIIPGASHAMMIEPGVRELARLLRGYLDTANRT